MRILLVISILFSSSCYTQTNNRFYNEFGLSIDSLLLGDWELESIEIVNGFYSEKDSNRIVSKMFEKNNLSIYSDSIFLVRDSTQDVFSKNMVFSYTFKNQEYAKNPILRMEENKYFKHRKRNHTSPFFDYEIIHCSDEKLVLLDRQLNQNGLTTPNISFIYNYRKPTIKSSMDSLFTSGHWQLCSENPIDFFSSISTRTYEFKKVDTNQIDERSQYKLDIEFIQNQNTKELICSNSSRHFYYSDGIIYKDVNYRIDEQKKMLFILLDKLYVYDILLINEQNLTLKLNEQLSKNFNLRIKNQVKN